MLLRNFIKRLALFSGIILIFLISADATLIHGLHLRKTGDYGHWNQVINGGIDADILVLGSSRAACHFDVEMLSERTGRSAYNLGLMGAPSSIQQSFYRTYRQYNDAPSVVIISLDLCALQPSEEIFNPAQYLPYLHEADLYDELLNIDPAFFKYRYVPFYGFATYGPGLTMMALEGMEGEENATDSIRLGYRPVERSFDGHMLKETPTKPICTIDGSLKDEFSAFIEGLQSEGITVILVYSPEYIENQARHVNRGELFESFQAVASEAEVPFLDWSQNAICSDSAFFYNPTHLNKIGAETFTRQLSKEIKPLFPVSE